MPTGQCPSLCWNESDIPHSTFLGVVLESFIANSKPPARVNFRYIPGTTILFRYFPSGELNLGVPLRHMRFFHIDLAAATRIRKGPILIWVR